MLLIFESKSAKKTKHKLKRKAWKDSKRLKTRGRDMCYGTSWVMLRRQSNEFGRRSGLE